MTLATGSFDTVIGTAIPCSGSSCTWELEDWGGGWVFSPDYYPSGELLFQTGAGSNSGSYSNKTADNLIRQTNFGDSTLGAHENFLAVEPAGGVAAEPALRADGGPEQPPRRLPAEPAAHDQPRELVLHEVGG